MSHKHNEAIYPISVAARLLDVHPRTLRIYEEEKLLKPARQGNKRFYSDDDIHWVQCLRKLIHEKGISIPGVKRLLELTPCWEIKECPAEIREQCTAFVDRTAPCWQMTRNLCRRRDGQCEGCEIYVDALEKAQEFVAENV